MLFFNDYDINDLKEKSIYRHRLYEEDENEEINLADAVVDPDENKETPSKKKTGDVQSVTSGKKIKPVMHKSFRNEIRKNFVDKYINRKDYSDVEAMLKGYGAKVFPNAFNSQKKMLAGMFTALHALKADADVALKTLTDGGSS